MPRPERYRAWAIWNLVGPVTTRVYGYHPMRKLGMGEDLPMEGAQIGHMGYFRAQVGAALWPHMLGWLGQHGL